MCGTIFSSIDGASVYDDPAVFAQFRLEDLRSLSNMSMSLVYDIYREACIEMNSEVLLQSWYHRSVFSGTTCVLLSPAAADPDSE